MISGWEKRKLYENIEIECYNESNRIETVNFLNSCMTVSFTWPSWENMLS